MLVPLLQPGFQLLHALVVPGEVLLLHVLGHLEAVHGVDRRVQKGVVLVHFKAIAEVVDVPIIASGGAGNIEDIVDVFEKTTATGALAASIFHFGEVNIGETKQVLADAGIEVRQ